MAALTAKLNFTKALLQGLPIPEKGKRTVYYDTKMRGLNLVVTDTGTKTFYLRRKHKGKSERVVIGRFPDLSVEQARGKAGDINSAFANGNNPAELRRLSRAEPTLGELFDEYLERYAKLHTKTSSQMEDSFRLYLHQWKNRKVSTVQRTDVQKLHTQLGKERGQVTANRTIELLRAVYNRGAQWGLCSADNPAAGITKFRIKARNRFLQSEELPRFFGALADEPNDTVRDFVLMSLLTGARKSNVLSMRWNEVSFEHLHWIIPETKNGETHTVPLVPIAIEILKARRQRQDKEEDHVFPGAGQTGHLASPKSAWRRILRRAGIQNLRLHDLRRSLGSWQAITGASLVVIGKTLGHKDVSTTAIYAHLSQDPQRRAMEELRSTRCWPRGRFRSLPKSCRCSPRGVWLDSRPSVDST